jgi:hypothetical protein
MVSDWYRFQKFYGEIIFPNLAAFAEFESSLIYKRTKVQGTILCRPKGSKDSKPRPKSGYLTRELNKRRSKEKKENYKSIDSCIY